MTISNLEEIMENEILEIEGGSTQACLPPTVIPLGWFISSNFCVTVAGEAGNNIGMGIIS